MTMWLSLLCPANNNLIKPKNLGKASVILYSSIEDMKEDEKLYIITDIFKIKKEYEELDRKKLKCPVFSCQKPYR